MPKVPTLDQSAVELQPTPIPKDAMGSLGKGIQDLSEGIGSLAEHFEKIQDDAETTRAEITATKQYYDIYQKALSDPDVFGAYDRAEEASQKMVEQVSTGISSTDARSKFQEDLSAQMAVKLTSLNSVLKSKQIDYDTALMGQDIDQQSHAYFSSVSPDEKAMHLNNIYKAIDTRINNGSIDPAKGLELKDATKEQLRLNQPIFDAELHGEGTLKQLLLGKNGTYKDLYDDERAGLIPKVRQIAEKQAKYQDILSTVAKNNNEADLMEGLFNGKKDVDNVIMQHIHGKVSNDFAQSYLKSLEEPKSLGTDNPENVQKRATSYLNALDKMQDPKSTPHDVMLDLMDRVSKGEITGVEAMGAYKAHYDNPDNNIKDVTPMSNQGYQQLVNKVNEWQAKQDDTRDYWAKAADMIKAYNDMPNNSPAAQLFKKMFKQYGGKDPSSIPDIAKSVIKEDIQKNNPGSSGTPNATMSAQGGFRNVWKSKSDSKANYKWDGNKIVAIKNDSN